MNEIIARLQDLRSDLMALRPNYHEGMNHQSVQLGFSCCASAQKQLTEVLASLNNARRHFGIKVPKDGGGGRC